ncbi:uncharacterized protein A1O5_05488 [Cladophialophora psammophila CBS 110553]|uniref:Uncharacterized protein n=1 Tax=Cladophialophora psammophila CBS 110553 TaxID=1182543 RepID=W9X2Y6_9EURO|nr:uncharacterized protein A1O5_05488 [Cladophialophora psammophila CBS 110553]EXJ71680.1 hypothetical protein A1O5_05488 [Cladophialophora psammophila CBS 110553]
MDGKEGRIIYISFDPELFFGKSSKAEGELAARVDLDLDEEIEMNNFFDFDNYYNDRSNAGLEEESLGRHESVDIMVGQVSAKRNTVFPLWREKPQ